jgi:ATP-dependent helicase/DNAse subunit B
MNKIELWTGIPDRSRFRRGIELSLEYARNGKSVWWIVETQRQSDQVEKSLIDRSDGSVIGIETILLQNVARKILEEHFIKVDILPREVRELLIGELISDKSIVNSVGVEPPISWAGKISNLYNRLLDEKINRGRDLRNRLTESYKWISDVLDKYENRIADRGLVDESYLPFTASEVLDRDNFTGPDLIIIDRYGAAPATQIRLLQKLVSSSNQSVVIVDDYGVNDNKNYSRDFESWSSLYGVFINSFDLGSPEVPPSGGIHIESESHAETILNGFLKKEKITLNNCKPISLIAETNIHVEVRSVANEIARLIYDEEISSDQIAIVTGDQMEYGERVLEIFPQYGLLPDIQIGTPLNKTDISALALKLLGLRAYGLKRESVVDILTNQFVKGPGLISDKKSVLRFDSIARKAGIKDGYGSLEKVWLEPLKRHAEYLKTKRDPLDPSQNEANVRWLNSANKDFELFARKVLSLPDPCTTSEVLEWFEEMFEFLNVRKNIHFNARTNPESGQKELLAMSRLNITLSHVAHALQIQRKSRLPVEKLLKTVERAIGKARVSVNKRLSGGVSLYSAEEIRGLEVEKIFLLGFTDKNWPPSPEIDVINPVGAEWINGDKLSEYRLLTLELYLNSSQLYLSMPCPIEGESKELPSPILGEMISNGFEVKPMNVDYKNFRSGLDLLPQVGREIEISETRDIGIRRLTAASFLNQGIKTDSVLHGISVELNRNNPSTLTNYDGMINNTIVLSDIEEKLSQKPLSATSLDLYAKCPMRYYFSKILALSELKEVVDVAEPSLKGQVIHEILANVSKDLRESDLGFWDDPERTKELLLSHAEQSMKKLPQWNLFSEAETQKIISGLEDLSATPGPLKLVLNHECKKGKDKVRFIEASFGLPVDEDGDLLINDPVTVQDQDVTVKLCGKIDRIGMTNKGEWRIWDYKISGSQQASIGKMKDGLSFQLPIYMYAFETYLQNNFDEGNIIEFAAYYQINEKKKKITEAGTLRFKAYEKEILTDFKSRITSIFKSIKNGNFHLPLSNNASLCPVKGYCDYKTICRRDFEHFTEREKCLDSDLLKNLYLPAVHPRYLEIQELKENSGGIN